MSKHLRKGFSKCLAFCDILVRALRHICWHLQQTRQSCGVTILPHHLSLARGVEVVLTHLYTVHICLTSVGLVFGEGPLESYDFLRSHLRVDPNLKASRHSQDLSRHAAIWCYIAPICSPFWSCLFQCWLKKKISAFFPHIYILCN